MEKKKKKKAGTIQNIFTHIKEKVAGKSLIKLKFSLIIQSYISDGKNTLYNTKKTWQMLESLEFPKLS